MLASKLEAARNYSILREFIFNTVYGFCKKTYENSIDVFKPVAGFLVNYICEFATSLEDRHFKLTLDLCYQAGAKVIDEEKISRLLYCIHAHFPKFFDSSR